MLLWLLGGVWGLPQHLIGAAMALSMRKHGHERFCRAMVTAWHRNAGLSLGFFVFAPAGAPRALLVHEYGHTIQSLILGPLYLPIVVVPSLVWAGVPALSRWRKRRHVSYYALPTERWANWLGERVCGEPSMGQAHVD